MTTGIEERIENNTTITSIERHLKATKTLLAVMAKHNHPLKNKVVSNMQASSYLLTQAYLQGFCHSK